MLVEVSDIYDAFFEVASVLWIKGEFKGRPDGTTGRLGPRFDHLMDELESDFFFAACSRRHAKTKDRTWIRPSQIKRYLRLHDANGNVIKGPGGEYRYQAFDWGTSEDETIDNRIAAGDLTPRSRTDTRIFLHLEDDH